MQLGWSVGEIFRGKLHPLYFFALLVECLVKTMMLYVKVYYGLGRMID